MFSRAIRSVVSGSHRWTKVGSVRFNSNSSLSTFTSLGQVLEKVDPPQAYTETPRAAEPTLELHIATLSKSRFIRPADLTFEERTHVPRYRKRALLGPSAEESKRLDVFYQLSLDPVHEAFNSALMSRYVSEMGKIKGRAETNLTWKNQRRLGKAIRRAKHMGIIPILSKRPLDGDNYKQKGSR